MIYVRDIFVLLFVGLEWIWSATGDPTCFPSSIFNCSSLPIMCPSWGYFDQNNGYFVYCKQENHRACLCECGSLGPAINTLLSICSGRDGVNSSSTDHHNFTLNIGHAKIARQRYFELLSQVKNQPNDSIPPSTVTSKTKTHQAKGRHGVLPFRMNLGLGIYYPLSYEFSRKLLPDPFQISGSMIAIIALGIMVFAIPLFLFLYRKPVALPTAVTRNNLQQTVTQV